MSCLLVFLGIWKISESITETFLELGLEFVSCLSCFQVILFYIFQIKIIHNKSSWHDMVLIDILNESSNASAFDKFLFAEGTFDFAKVASKTCDKQMREAMFLNKLKVTLLPSS